MKTNRFVVLFLGVGLWILGCNGEKAAKPGAEPAQAATPAAKAPAALPARASEATKATPEAKPTQESAPPSSGQARTVTAGPEGSDAARVSPGVKMKQLDSANAEDKHSFK
jgi:hypothetical protein